jgi:hypothetical protein
MMKGARNSHSSEVISLLFVDLRSSPVIAGREKMVLRGSLAKPVSPQLYFSAIRRSVKGFLISRKTSHIKHKSRGVHGFVDVMISSLSS